MRIGMSFADMGAGVGFVAGAECGEHGDLCAGDGE